MHQFSIFNLTRRKEKFCVSLQHHCQGSAFAVALLIQFFISLDGNWFNPKIVLIDKHSFEVSKELKFCTFFLQSSGCFSLQLAHIVF